MKKLLIIAVAAIVLLAVSAALGAKTPKSQTAGSLTVLVGKAVSEPVSLYCLPNGGGNALSSAFAYKGGPVDATLTITVVDEYNHPVVGLPAENIMLGPVGTKNSFCGQPGSNFGAGATDENGIIVLNGPLKGGGYVAPTGEGLIVMVTYGDLAGESAPIGVYMNSPDLNGDGVVDAADQELFDRDASFKYNFRSDFNWDGKVDAFDQVILSSAMGKSCS